MLIDLLLGLVALGLAAYAWSQLAPDSLHAARILLSRGILQRRGARAQRLRASDVEARRLPTPEPSAVTPAPSVRMRPRRVARPRESGPAPSGMAFAVLGAELVLTGIVLMQRTGDAPLILRTGILATVFPNPVWVLIGTLCGLLGCVLTFVWLPAYLQPQGAGGWAQVVGARAPARRRPLRIRLAAGLIAGGLYAYALVQAPRHNSGAVVLLSLIASAILCGVAINGALPSRGRHVAEADVRLTWRDAAPIIAVSVAFVALNAHDARNWLYGYWGDEWAFYNSAKAIALGQNVDFLSQAGVYGIHPIADSAYQALVMHLFGLNILGWRMASILSVALPVVALYWLAKEIGGAIYATVASIIYGTCHLLWAFAHIGYNNNDLLLPMIPAAALLYVGLRRESAVLLFAAGACAGAGWYTIFTGRLMIGVLGLVTLTCWQGRWRVVWRNLVALLAGFVLVVLPLALDNGSDLIRQMLPLVNLSHARTNAPLSSLLPQNTVRGLYAFLYATENTHYVVGAVFDVVSAAALCLGVVMAVRMVRDLAMRLLLVWFAITLMLTTPFYYAPQIADTRIQAAIPVAALLAALGLCAVCCAVQVALSLRETGAVFAASLAIAVTTATALNGYRFYVTMPRQLQVSPIAMTIGAITGAPHSGTVLGGDLSDGNLCQVLDGFEIDPASVLHFVGTTLAPTCPTSRPVTMLPHALVVLSSEVLPSVQECRARLSRLLVAPNGQQVLWGYRFDVGLHPIAGYMSRVSREAAHLCPPVPALAQR